MIILFVQDIDFAKLMKKSDFLRPVHKKVKVLNFL